MSKRRKIFLKVFYYIFVSVILLALGMVCLGIIFYASGYKINWKAKKIDKTGMLVVNSQEDGLKIFIDKKQINTVQGRSAVIFSSSYTATLLPGEYDLEIRKDGRVPYDEHIVVEKELVTKIDNVLLLPEKIPDKTFLNKELSSYSFSPDNKKIVYQTPDNKVLTYNIDTAQEKMLDEKTIKEKVTSYTWDAGSSRVALKINKKEGDYYYILDPENLQNSFFLQDRMSYLPFFDDIYFSPSNPDELFGINKKDLYKINTSSSKVEKVVENISHFIQKKNFFYYLDKDNSLIQFAPESSRGNVILEKFQLSNDFDLLPINRESDIYIKNAGSLYLIEDKNNLKLIDKDVEGFLTESNDSQFIYTKEFEVWIYDSNKEVAKMLTRFGKKIENIQEFYNDKYLLYQQGQDLEVIKKDSKNSQEIKNSVENVKVLDKNKIVVVEANDLQTIFKLIDLSAK